MNTNKSYKICFGLALIIIICFSCFIQISAQQTGDDYQNLADIAEDNGELDQAVTYYLLAADQYEKEENPGDAGWSCLSAGTISIKLKKYENAFSYLVRSANLFEQDETPVNATVANLFAGIAKYKLKQYSDAANVFNSAATSAVELEVYHNAGYAYDGAGHAIKYSNWTSAQNYWNLAKENFNKVGKSYTIPSDLQIEVESPSKKCKILFAMFFNEIDTFQQGEAVQISGQVLYKGEPTPPRRQYIRIELIVPDCSVPPEQSFVNLTTDEVGKFSLRPFAGWNIGLYSIVATVDYTPEETGEKIYVSDTIHVVVKESTEADFTKQVNEIIEHYYKAIPKGPLWTEPEAYSIASKIYSNTLLKQEMKWGWVHNILRYFELSPYHKFDPLGYFTCEGYQRTVMHFLDSIRFNADPEIRVLMEGIDYGPIERGAGSSNHLAVVLFPIGSDWMDDNSIVFDPWFTQSPNLFTMKEWRSLETMWSSWEPRVDRKSISFVGERLWAGFPISGSSICPNVGKTNPFYLTAFYKPAYIFTTSCPVNILIVDEEGNQSGIVEDGTFVLEFPANIHCFENEESAKDYFWFAELPKGNYTVNITGIENGEFSFVLANDTNQSAPLQYGLQSLSKDQTATIQLGYDDIIPKLILPDGTAIEPNISPVGTKKKNISEGTNSKSQIYPNPFNGSTQIVFQHNKHSWVYIDIFDFSGKHICNLLNDRRYPGEYKLLWNGTDTSGNELESGIYLCKIQTGDYKICHKLVLIR